MLWLQHSHSMTWCCQHGQFPWCLHLLYNAYLCWQTSPFSLSWYTKLSTSLWDLESPNNWLSSFFICDVAQSTYSNVLLRLPRTSLPLSLAWYNPIETSHGLRVFLQVTKKKKIERKSICRNIFIYLKLFPLSFIYVCLCIIYLCACMLYCMLVMEEVSGRGRIPGATVIGCCGQSNVSAKNQSGPLEY